MYVHVLFSNTNTRFFGFKKFVLKFKSDLFIQACEIAANLFMLALSD